MIEKGLEHTLRDILGRSEETVRAFDIKSEIAMLCFVLSVEAGQAFINLSQLGTTRPYLSLVLLVTFIAALFAYMSVLFPAQNPKLLKGLRWNSTCCPKEWRTSCGAPSQQLVSTSRLRT